jgi:xanthine dehydrogenase YagR molybdenum-binding subunit
VGDHVAYRGQPIALVVADTLPAATETAAAITAGYEAEPFAGTMEAEGAETLVQSDALPARSDIALGDADTAFAGSPVQVDNEFQGPPQHDVPMELMSSVIEWRAGTLVVHESRQTSGAIHNGLALQLRIDADAVQVISPSPGGGFGQRNSLLPHIGPLATAARRLGRPVKLMLTRPQTFHQAAVRPASLHRVRLDADPSGRLLAAIHKVDQQAWLSGTGPNGRCLLVQ